MIREFVCLRTQQRTAMTALSNEVETPPPRLKDAMEGRPVRRYSCATKFRPEILYQTIPFAQGEMSAMRYGGYRSQIVYRKE